MNQILKWELWSKPCMFPQTHTQTIQSEARVGGFKFHCPICGVTWLSCDNRTLAKDWDFFCRICQECGDGRVLITNRHTAVLPPYSYTLLKREFLLESDPNFGVNFRAPEPWHSWRLPL